jgi:hypothetical protein
MLQGDKSITFQQVYEKYIVYINKWNTPRLRFLGYCAVRTTWYHNPEDSENLKSHSHKHGDRAEIWEYIWQKWHSGNV